MYNLNRLNHPPTREQIQKNMAVPTSNYYLSKLDGYDSYENVFESWLIHMNNICNGIWNFLNYS